MSIFYSMYATVQQVVFSPQHFRTVTINANDEYKTKNRLVK